MQIATVCTPDCVDVPLTGAEAGQAIGIRHQGCAQGDATGCTVTPP